MPFDCEKCGEELYCVVCDANALMDELRKRLVEDECKRCGRMGYLVRDYCSRACELGLAVNPLLKRKAAGAS